VHGMRSARDRLTLPLADADGSWMVILKEVRYASCVGLFPLCSPSGRYVALAAYEGDHQFHEEIRGIAADDHDKSSWTKYGIRSAGLLTGICAFQLQI
jgi:hypothetical protein